MRNVPSIDLASIEIPEDAVTARPLSRFTTKQLKDELLNRNCVDFSKVSLWLKLSPVIVLFALACSYKLGQYMDGTLLGCILR